MFSCKIPNFWYLWYCKWLWSGFACAFLAARWAGLGRNFLKGRFKEVSIAYAAFISSFSTSIITSLSIGSIRAEYYTLMYPLRYGFKPYMKTYMASSFASSGNATTTLSNAVMYCYTELCCHSSQNLSLVIFLSSKRVYWFMKSFMNSSKWLGCCLILPIFPST